jgi:hypothetical protein
VLRSAMSSVSVVEDCEGCSWVILSQVYVCVVCVCVFVETEPGNRVRRVRVTTGKVQEARKGGSE